MRCFLNINMNIYFKIAYFEAFLLKPTIYDKSKSIFENFKIN